MSKFAVFCLSLALVAAATQGVALETESLVKDGTFKVEQKGNRFGAWLVNYKLLQSNPDIVKLDREVFCKDGASIKLDNPKGPSVGIMQNLSGIKPKSKYRISFQLKLQNVAPDKPGAWGGAVLNMWHGGNKWFPHKALSGTADWKYYEFIYLTPDNAKPDATISPMIINGKGAAWFDDIRMDEIK